MKVLVAEDDGLTRAGLIQILEGEGYETIGASSGSEALALYARERPDFLCLDIMMPEKSGYDVCREVRGSDPQVPIIFISAKSEEIDRVVGLELGADDFIVKPFGVKEVIARIRSVSRRCLASRPATSTADVFEVGDLEVRPAELRAFREGQAIDLSLRDVRILRLFFQRRGEVLDREALTRAGWGHDHLPLSRSLDQHISQLRRRIERDPKLPSLIRTVHGAGYRYE